MKTFRAGAQGTDNRKEDIFMGEFTEHGGPDYPHHRGGHPLPPHLLGGSPIPQHERRGLLYVEFDEVDRQIFYDVFKDADTAEANMKIVLKAPPEMKILVAQVLMSIKEVGHYEY